MNDDSQRDSGRGLRGAVAGVLRSLGLHRLTVAVVDLESKRTESRRLGVWSRALNAALRGRENSRLMVGEFADGAIPVIVCMWARPDRLAAVLAQLSAQQDSPPIRLIVWNNRREFSPRYEREISEWGARGAIASVEFVSATENIGGIARFVVARWLLDAGYSGPFITLDDDQQISSSFVRDLIAAREPGGIAGWWAFTTTDDYWQRRPAQPGDAATYVGTGGAIFDTRIVADRRFFSELPPRFGFLEDIWACDWVVRHGGHLRKAETDIEFVQEELNQHHALIDLKAEFVRYLAARRR